MIEAPYTDNNYSVSFRKLTSVNDIEEVPVLDYDHNVSDFEFLWIYHVYYGNNGRDESIKL